VLKSCLVGACMHSRVHGADGINPSVESLESDALTLGRSKSDGWIEDLGRKHP
jgi:hypothetical protein